MGVGCKATAYDGLADVGKGGRKIRFGKVKKEVEVDGRRGMLVKGRSLVR